MLYLALATQDRVILVFVGSLSVNVGKPLVIIKSMKNLLLALGTIVFLALLVLIAQRQQDKPKTLAQPAKVVLGKGEYMRPMRTNSVPVQTGPVEIHSKVRVSQ